MGWKITLSVSYSLQFKRKCTGLSVSNLLSWPFSIQCPVFSLAILEIPLLEVFFRGVALSVNFLWDMLGTMSLYIVCFEFSHLLIHLLMESILVPYCISDGDSWVLGCRCFAFYEAVFASESARSFSSIRWWAGQYTNLMFCTFGLVQEILTNCFYSGIMIVFSVLGGNSWYYWLTFGKYVETIIWGRNVVSCIFCCYFIAWPHVFYCLSYFHRGTISTCFLMITPDLVGLWFDWANPSIKTIMVLLVPVSKMELM